MKIYRELLSDEVRALLNKCETCIHKDDDHNDPYDPCYSCDFENNYRSVFDEPN